MTLPKYIEPLMVSFPLCISFVMASFLKSSFWGAELYCFLILGLSCLAYIIQLYYKRFNVLNITISDILFLSFIACSLVSTFVSTYPDRPSDRIFMLIVFLFIFLNHKSLQIADKTGRALFFVILLSVVGAAILAFVKYALLDVEGKTFSHYLMGSFTNPAIHASFMAVGIPVYWVALLHKGPWHHKVLIAICFITVLLSLLLAGSRIALVAALMAMTILCIDRNFLYETIRGKRKIIFFAICLSLFLFLSWFLYTKGFGSISGRLLIWKISLQEMFAEHPFVGIGFGNFFVEYINAQAAYFESGNFDGGEGLLAGMTYHPFNEFLKVLIEGGLIGFLLFTIFIIRSMAVGFKNAKALRDANTTLFATVALSIVVCSLFSYPLEDLSISFLFIGSLVYATREDNCLLRLEIKGRYTKIILYFISGMFLLVSVVKMWAIFEWKTAYENIIAEETKAYRTYRQIYPIMSCNGAFLYNYGVELFSIGSYEDGVAMLEKAKRYGNSLELYEYTGKSYLSLGNYEKAEENFKKATYISPKKIAPLKDLLDFYKQTNQILKAKEVALKIISQPVKVQSGEIVKIKEYAQWFLKENL